MIQTSLMGLLITFDVETGVIFPYRWNNITDNE